MNLFERLLPRVGDTVLGRFRLERELGRGGFGVVYQARQLSIDQTVALKVLLPHILSNQELVDRFAREVAVARNLQHPNTIRIIDYDRTPEGIPFYAMEYVTGRTLVDELRGKGAMPEMRARRIVAQVLKSLAEAHAKGVIHRDLKPANIMLCDIYGEHDFVKVLDFGIAKALTGEESHTTKTGMLLGSPPYMSPEQARARKDLDNRSDLYSVGLILAECLTGLPVVQVSELGQVLALQLSAEQLPFAPRVVNSPLFPVIVKATAKDREDRHRDAAEMRAHLESLELPEGFATAPGVGNVAVPAPAPSPVPGQYGTPLPSGVAVSTTPHPSGQFTPRPSPSGVSIGGATPQPSPPGGPISGQMFVAGATIADTAEAPSKKRRRAGVSWVLVVLLLLVVGGVAAVVIVGPGGGPDETGDTGHGGLADRTDVGPSGDVDGGLAGRGDVGGGAAGEHGEGPDGGVSGETGQHVALATEGEHGEGEQGEADPERVAAAAGVSLARSEVYASIPHFHELSFGGMSGVTVRQGDAILGVTPFVLQVPNAPHEVELTLERRGYRTDQMRLSLARADPVEVSLRREREQVPEEHGGGGEQETGSSPDAGSTIEIPEVVIH